MKKIRLRDEMDAYGWGCIVACVLLILFTATASIANAEEDDATEFLADILITAKMTGMCGVIEQMMAFQKATQLEGGDEFIVRFWTTEAARLGWTLEEMVEICNESTENYSTLATTAGLK